MEVIFVLRFVDMSTNEVLLINYLLINNTISDYFVDAHSGNYDFEYIFFLFKRRSLEFQYEILGLKKVKQVILVVNNVQFRRSVYKSV